MTRCVRLLAWTALAAGVPGATVRAQDGFVVIVHVANPVTHMTPVDLSHVFLRRIATWEDGTAIEPVDLPENAPLRAEFSRVIHGRGVDALTAYWRQQTFAGKGVAPPVRRTPAEVVAFVASNPRAIGYVASGTTLPPQVKALAVDDAAQTEVYDAASVDPPTRLTSPPLRYPALLRRDGIEGRVILEIIVMPDGRVASNDIAVVESTDDRFNDAAVSVVRGTRFTPGHRNGEPVAVRVRQRVEFKIAR